MESVQLLKENFIEYFLKLKHARYPVKLENVPANSPSNSTFSNTLTEQVNSELAQLNILLEEGIRFPLLEWQTYINLYAVPMIGKHWIFWPNQLEQMEELKFKSLIGMLESNQYSFWISGSCHPE